MTRVLMLVIMYQPFNEDGRRARLQWLGDPAICAGVKLKYLKLQSSIIVHTFEEPVDDDHWKPFLWKKLIADPMQHVMILPHFNEYDTRQACPKCSNKSNVAYRDTDLRFFHGLLQIPSNTTSIVDDNKREFYEFLDSFFLGIDIFHLNVRNFRNMES